MLGDKISLDRLNLLHPAIRGEAIEAYLEACKLTPVGVHPFITQTDRSFEESDHLYQQGRTVPGSIVTNAKAGQSYHNYKMALDFCLQIGGKAIWDQKNPNWKIVVDCFKKRGFKWGGDWVGKLKDYPHLEKTLGYNWQQLLAKHNSGDFIPGHTYVNV